MKINKKWFSIVIVLLIVIIINLIAIWILSYIIPFSKDIKWIENSSKAYYEANSWIENVLYELKSTPVWYETWRTLNISSPIDYSYNVISTWTTLPPAWKWNSEYDSDWDIISTWNPIQLEIWYGKFDFNTTEFSFRVPDINWTDANIQTLSWTTDPIINWQISTSNNSINASWSYIKASDTCNSNQVFDNCKLNFSSYQWVDLSDNSTSNEKILNFYTANCGTWSWCILKLSVINKLELNSNNLIIPYLEWQIKSIWSVPLRYSLISSEWKSYWYKKELDIRVSQQTTSEAFDFTIFQ